MFFRTGWRAVIKLRDVFLVLADLVEPPVALRLLSYLWRSLPAPLEKEPQLSVKKERAAFSLPPAVTLWLTIGSQL